MSRLVWDQDGERYYETGIEKGVLFPKTNAGGYGAGVAWNGLINVSEKPSGAEANPQYADNIKYLNLTSKEEFAGSIEAFTYPDEWAECDGSAQIATGVYAGQQGRKEFGLAYRTVIGNDTEENDHGYKLHLVYGGKAATAERTYATVNESPEAMTLSWEFTTTPVAITGHKPSACITIDSRTADATKLASLETILYGVDASAEGVTPAVTAVDPRLPLPDEVITIMGEVAAG